MKSLSVIFQESAKNQSEPTKNHPRITQFHVILAGGFLLAPIGFRVVHVS